MDHKGVWLGAAVVLAVLLMALWRLMWRLREAVSRRKSPDGWALTPRWE